jgi:hypothetical protein
MKRTAREGDVAELPSSTARDELTRGDASSNVRDVAMHADPHAGGGLEADEIYATVSALYHALKGAIAYDKYVGDAQKAGDQELERFFRSCRGEEQARARRARALLVARLASDEEPLGVSSDEVEAGAPGDRAP